MKKGDDFPPANVGRKHYSQFCVDLKFRNRSCTKGDSKRRGGGGELLTIEELFWGSWSPIKNSMDSTSPPNRVASGLKYFRVGNAPFRTSYDCRERNRGRWGGKDYGVALWFCRNSS